MKYKTRGVSQAMTNSGLREKLSNLKSYSVINDGANIRDTIINICKCHYRKRSSETCDP